MKFRKFWNFIFFAQNPTFQNFTIFERKKEEKKNERKFFITRKIFFANFFFQQVFHFRKLHKHSFLTSYRTPPNSFWSPRTSYLNLRVRIFYQRKSDEFLGQPWADRYKPAWDPWENHQIGVVFAMGGPLRGLKMSWTTQGSFLGLITNI